MKLSEFKKKYPAYQDVDDDKLADALHKKYYSDKLSASQFREKVGLSPETISKGEDDRGALGRAKDAVAGWGKDRLQQAGLAQGDPRVGPISEQDRAAFDPDNALDFSRGMGQQVKPVSPGYKAEPAPQPQPDPQFTPSEEIENYKSNIKNISEQLRQTETSIGEREEDYRQELNRFEEMKKKIESFEVDETSEKSVGQYNDLVDEANRILGRARMMGGAYQEQGEKYAQLQQEFEKAKAPRLSAHKPEKSFLPSSEKLSEEEKANAVIQLLAKEEGVPVTEYEEGNKEKIKQSLQQAGRTVQQIGKVYPVLEALGFWTTQPIGAAASGLAGIAMQDKGRGSILGDIRPPGRQEEKSEQDEEREILETMQAIQETIGYQPRTKEGHSFTQTSEYPFRQLEETGARAGQSTLEATESPEWATLVHTMIAGAPVLLMGLRPGKAASRKAASGVRQGWDSFLKTDAGRAYQKMSAERRVKAAEKAGKDLAEFLKENPDLTEAQIARMSRQQFGKYFEEMRSARATGERPRTATTEPVSETTSPVPGRAADVRQQARPGARQQEAVRIPERPAETPEPVQEGVAPAAPEAQQAGQQVSPDAVIRGHPQDVPGRVETQVMRGLRDAEGLRKDEGAVQERGLERPGREEEGRADLQRQQEEGAEAGDAQERQVEAAEPAESPEAGAKPAEPKFQTYDEAQQWVESKAQEYGGKKKFAASDEYKNAYPEIDRLYQEERAESVKNADKAMRDAGVSIGDKVEYTPKNLWGAAQGPVTGKIVERGGTPYVQIDEGQPAASGKKRVRWHDGWQKTAPEPPDLIYTKKGNPFKSEKAAELSMKSRKIDGKVESVEGGFAIRQVDKPGTGTSVSTKKPSKFDPNVVFREVRDNDGNVLGWVQKPYDGSKAGARKAAEEISDEMFNRYEDASNIQSRIGATDGEAKPKYTVSPNFKNVNDVEAETAAAKYTWGDIETGAPKAEAAKTTQEPAEAAPETEPAEPPSAKQPGEPAEMPDRYWAGDRVEYRTPGDQPVEADIVDRMDNGDYKVRTVDADSTQFVKPEKVTRLIEGGRGRRQARSYYEDRAKRAEPAPSTEKTYKADIPEQKAQTLSPKEQKQHFLKQIDEAIKEAPDYPARMGFPDVETVTIEVPGDGEFHLLYTKAALKEARKKVNSAWPTSVPKAAPTKPKSTPAKTINTRIKSSAEEGSTVEYYNEFRPRAQKKVVSGKVTFWKDGIYSNGSYLIKLPEKPKLTKAQESDLQAGKDPYNLQDILDTPVKPARLMGETAAPGLPDPMAHVRSKEYGDFLYRAEIIDNILTHHPEATPGMADSGLLIFKKGGESVAAAMPVDVAKVDFPTEYQSRRFSELYGEELKGMDRTTVKPVPAEGQTIRVWARQRGGESQYDVVYGEKPSPLSNEKITSLGEIPNTHEAFDAAMYLENGDYAVGRLSKEKLKQRIQATAAKYKKETPQPAAGTEASGAEYARDADFKSRYTGPDTSDYTGQYGSGGNMPAAMDMPEIVELAQSLLDGEMPRVMRNLRSRGAAGVFKHQGQQGNIDLLAGIFESPEIARKVLAHEIGHVVDWLPQKILDRGNLLGRVASLKRNMQGKLPLDPKQPPKELTPERKKELLREARELAKKDADRLIDEEIIKTLPVTPEDVLAIWNEIAPEQIVGKDLIDYVKGLDTKTKKSIVKQALRGETPTEMEQFAKTVAEKTGKKVRVGGYHEKLKKRYRDLIKKELENRKYVYDNQIREELKNFSQKWKPFDPKADAKYTKYRFSGKELYADAISGLVTNPAVLKGEAPTFYEAFFNYLDRKPQVAKTYEQIQEDIARGPEELAEQRAERLKTGFESGAKLRREQMKALQKHGPGLSGAWESLLTWFDDKNTPIYRRVIRKFEREKDANGNLTKRAKQVRELRYRIGELENFSTMAQAFLIDLRKQVLSPLRENEVSLFDLDYYLFQRRVIGERFDIANPLGHYKELSERDLAQTLRKWGTKKSQVIQKAAWEFRDLRENEVIPILEDSGLYTPELIERMKNTTDYATFSVNKYLTDKFGTGIGAKIHPQYGTLQEVGSLVEATLIKDIQTMRAALTNKMKQEFEAVALETDVTLLEPAEMYYSKDFGKQMPKPPSERGKDLFTVFHEGKPVHYYTDKAIADVFQYDPVRASGFEGVMKILGRIPREAYVGKNPEWMVRNIPRDFFETGQKLSEVRIRNLPELARMYREAYKDVKRYIYNKELSPDMREMAKRGMFPVSRMWGGTDPTVTGEIIGVIEEEFPELADESAKEYPQAVKALKWTWDQADKAASMTEIAGKVAAYKFLVRNFPEKSMGEIGRKVRDMSATPNIRQKGTLNNYTNNLFPFSTVGRSGLKATWASFRDDPGPYIWKTTVFNVIPALLRHGFKAGTILYLMEYILNEEDPDNDKQMSMIERTFKGEERTRLSKTDERLAELDARQRGKLREFISKNIGAVKHLTRMYKGIPAYQMENWQCFPLYLREDGKTVYLRIPQDYEGMYISRLTSDLVKREFTGPEGMIQSFAQWSPYNLNELIKQPKMWIEYFGMGKTPIDGWTGQPILSRQEELAGGKYAAGRLAKHSWSQIGGRLIYEPAWDKLETDRTAWEEFLNSQPGKILGSWIKITDKGLTEEFYNRVEKQRKIKAIESLEKKDAYIKLANGEMISGEEALLILSDSSSQRQEKLIDQLTRKSGNAYARMLRSANTKKEKAIALELMLEHNFRQKPVE